MEALNYDRSVGKKEDILQVSDCLSSGKRELIAKESGTNNEIKFGSYSSKGVLSIDVMKKMINRFLSDKQMPKEDLAKLLGIRETDLEYFFVDDKFCPLDMLSKINLPLIELYCETRWKGVKA